MVRSQLLALIAAHLAQYEDFPGVLDDLAAAEYFTGNGDGVAYQERGVAV